jgi:hypothetical protein
MIQGSGRCHYHPDRSGLGVCVECRQVVCRECTTQFDGINRCANCLSGRLARNRALRPRREWTVGNLALASISFGAVLGAVWVVARIFQR